MAGQKVIKALDLFLRGRRKFPRAKMAGICPVGGLDLWPIATAAYEANFGVKTWCSKAEDVNPRRFKRRLVQLTFCWLLLSAQTTVLQRAMRPVAS